MTRWCLILDNLDSGKSSKILGITKVSGKLFDADIVQKYNCRLVGLNPDVHIFQILQEIKRYNTNLKENKWLEILERN